MRAIPSAFPLRRLALPVVAWLLAIEFLDEFVFGVREAAWPAIRSDLSLSYAQVGLLLAIPELVSAFTDPVLGILGDSRWRHRIVGLGAILFSVGIALMAVSTSFAMLLAVLVVLYPASGAFVSLSQASLMDMSGDDHDAAMAKWTLAGSFGVVAGPLALSAVLLIGAGWRELLLGLALVSLLVAAGSRGARASGATRRHADFPGPDDGFAQAAVACWRAAHRPETWRWLVLLAMSNLMLDVFLAFLALYLVDSAGLSLAQSTFAVGVWAATGLLGDALLVVVLRRIDGIRYLRWSAVMMASLLPAFLTLPGFLPRLLVLGAMGLLNSGWYAIPKARLYASLPGQSGAVMALYSASGLATAAIPAFLGLVAATWGIEPAMWLLLAGPLALVLGLPRGPRTAALP